MKNIKYSAPEASILTLKTGDIVTFSAGNEHVSLRAVAEDILLDGFSDFGGSAF